MEANTAPQVNQDQLRIIQQKLFLDNKIRSGLNWFYWIGAMSILNSVIAATSGSISFVIGLGITQFIDGFMLALAKDIPQGGSILQIIGWIINLVIAGFFILLGFLSKKRIRWLIITGMAFYALDAIIIILFRDYIAVLFHGWALFSLWGALSNMKKLRQLEELNSVESIQSLQSRNPALTEVQPSAGISRTSWFLIFCIILVLGVAFLLASIIKF
jgi:hypothetical protein